MVGTCANQPRLQCYDEGTGPANIERLGQDSGEILDKAARIWSEFTEKRPGTVKNGEICNGFSAVINKSQVDFEPEV